MPPDTNEHLVVALRHVADDLTRRRTIRDTDRTLRLIVASAVETVPGVDAGSISKTEHGRIETRQPTSEAIGELDDLQSRLHEGPCISAIEEPPESGILVAQDLAGGDAERWPRYAPHVVGAEFRGLMSTQLSTADGPRAALNLYSREPNAFDEDSRTMAGLFGAQAAPTRRGTCSAPWTAATGSVRPRASSWSASASTTRPRSG
jgi:GAF domain